MNNSDNNYRESVEKYATRCGWDSHSDEGAIEYISRTSYERGLADGKSKQPELTVWEGPMPESNGKTNFTAILKRKGASFFDTNHLTIAQSEYPDRVRYEADCVKYLIGEIDQDPCILDYDTDKHSGYEPQKE